MVDKVDIEMMQNSFTLGPNGVNGEVRIYSLGTQPYRSESHF